MTKLLLIEDDTKLIDLLVSDFELEGYEVRSAVDGVAGLDAARRWKPDVIVLDIMLPKMNGYDVCRALRQEGSVTPILMLTAKGQESEKVIGLEVGADDYLTKPFGGMELRARIKALLRRQGRLQKTPETVSFLDVMVNFAAMQATKAGKPLHLTPKEFQILELLIRHRGNVVRRQTLLEDIWGYDETPTTRTVDNQVLTLRQKLTGPKQESPIVTVHGVGYRFGA